MSIESGLRKGIYVAPGYYMKFWRECVLGSLNEDTVRTHNKLKQYRELFFGAIFAAAYSKNKHNKYFIGVPQSEPSDVDIASFDEQDKKTPFKLGHLQLTRCNLSMGETLYGQILKKNKVQNKDIELLVHVEGDGQRIDLGDLAQELAKVELHFRSIFIVGLVKESSGILLNSDTFSIDQIYPKQGGVLINTNDPQAFFMNPNIIGLGSLKKNPVLEFNGYYLLRTPTIE